MSAVCAWTLTVHKDSTEYHQRILPDGCADIIWSDHADPLVVGPMTRPTSCIVAPGTTLWGIRFRPGLAAAVFGVPANEIADRHIALEELWGRGGREVSAQLRSCRTLRNGVIAIEHTLAQRDSWLKPDPLVSAVIATLRAKRAISIERWARQAGISERQLRRRFTASVGYGPKLFQRVVRFQALLALSSQRQHRDSLWELAYAAGYADQAHMTREVREFAATTPAAVFGAVTSALTLSGLLR